MSIEKQKFARRRELKVFGNKLILDILGLQIDRKKKLKKSSAVSISNFENYTRHFEVTDVKPKKKKDLGAIALLTL